MSGMILDGRRIGLLTGSASRAGGGVFEAVVLQAQLIRHHGGTPVVFAIRDEFSDADSGRFEGCDVHFSDRMGPAMLGIGPHLPILLDAAGLDCLHLHGIWLDTSRVAADWADRNGKPLVISPHGMLDPWITGRGKWKKALARAAYEKRAWRSAAAMHALTVREATDIERESGRGDTLVIPNPAPTAVETIVPANRPIVGYLGRIHPKKNIDALITAWEHLGTAGRLPAGAELQIAGWGAADDVAALEARVSASREAISFLGPLHGDGKTQFFSQARFIALPSLSEGLPMVVLEAWSAGRPTVMSAEVNIPTGFSANAAIECGTQPSEIANALATAFATSNEDWKCMAENALALARGAFAFETVAKTWAATYEQLIANRKAPI